MKQENTLTLYNVFYLDETYGDSPSYEVTTDNFDKWLEEHNKNRIAEGAEPEEADDFEVEEIYPKLFNESKKA